MLSRSLADDNFIDFHTVQPSFSSSLHSRGRSLGALVKDELFRLKIFDVFFFLSSSNALEMIVEQEVIAQ